MSTNRKPTALVVGGAEDFGVEIMRALEEAGFACVRIDAPAGGLEQAIGAADEFEALILNRPFRAGTTRFLDITDAQFDAAVERAVVEPMLAIKAAAARMKSGGSIVEVTSRAHLGAWLSADIAAACGAAATMGRCLAIELVKVGIRVNVVSPPFVDEVDKSPSGRDQVASAVAFFAGPKSAPASGLTFMLDGIVSMQLGEMARR